MATDIYSSFRLVKSSKGTDKLSHDAYLYIFHRGTVKREWRCDVRGVKSTGKHSHPKEYGKEEVALVKEKIRKRGRETNDNPYVPFGEITSSLSESAVFTSNSTRPK